MEHRRALMVSWKVEKLPGGVLCGSGMLVLSRATRLPGGWGVLSLGMPGHDLSSTMMPRLDERALDLITLHNVRYLHLPLYWIQ